jgi:hypothetical protein
VDSLPLTPLDAHTRLEVYQPKSRGYIRMYRWRLYTLCGTMILTFLSLETRAFKYFVNGTKSEVYYCCLYHGADGKITGWHKGQGKTPNMADHDQTCSPPIDTHHRCQQGKYWRPIDKKCEKPWRTPATKCGTIPQTVEGASPLAGCRGTKNCYHVTSGDNKKFLRM